jgi:hypothetical protein
LKLIGLAGIDNVDLVAARERRMPPGLHVRLGNAASMKSPPTFRISWLAVDAAG